MLPLLVVKSKTQFRVLRVKKLTLEDSNYKGLVCLFSNVALFCILIGGQDWTCSGQST